MNNIEVNYRKFKYTEDFFYKKLKYGNVIFYENFIHITVIDDWLYGGKYHFHSLYGKGPDSTVFHAVKEPPVTNVNERLRMVDINNFSTSEWTVEFYVKIHENHEKLMIFRGDKSGIILKK